MVNWGDAAAEWVALVWSGLTDKYVFPALQLFFVAFIAFAILRDLGFPPRAGRVTLRVLRGGQSRGYFHLAYGFVSVIILQLVNSTEAWKGHKTITGVVDLGALSYLCFLNGWFRNKVVGLASWWQQRWEE